MLLAIDTSTTAIGAAVLEGPTVRSRVVTLDGRRHAELLAPAIQQALSEAGVDRLDLTSVVCGVGPGPFTGLRVGVVTALVLAEALGLPAPHGICSLDAIAEQCVGRHEGRLLVATDARRKEVYSAVYEIHADRAERVSGPQVGKAQDLPSEVRALPTAGRGALLYPDALSTPLPDAPLDVDPGALGQVAVRFSGTAAPGEAGAAAGIATGLLPPEPLYLRRPDAVASLPPTVVS